VVGIGRLRKIERHLYRSWRTIKKYLDAPAQSAAPRQRQSKLDPFKLTIAELLEKDPVATATVIRQRLRSVGYDGAYTIPRECVRATRPARKPPRAFLRMESPAGERFEVDWGHFGVLDYAGDKRKLYAFALVEAHSRMLYLEFTHSQSFETFARCHVHAFLAMGGVARESREKGKVERAIGYARQAFWPVREFTDLNDVNRQARQWLAEIANQRQHRETRERPMNRFKAEALRPLPVIPYDYRDTVEALVYKDLRLHFDGNRHCVPPRFAGRRLTIKADSSSVTIYDRVHEIVSYPRCWGSRADSRRRPLRRRTGGPASRGCTIARPATALRPPGKPLLPCHARSVFARHGRYRPGLVTPTRPDTKHRRASTVPVPADGAGGSDMR